MNRLKGFTIIEIMTTLLIASILIGYAMPSIQQLQLNNLMNSERNRLTSSLYFARYYAITHQYNVIICPSLTSRNCDNQSNWHQGWMVFRDDNKNRQLDEDEILLKSEDAMKNDVIATSSRYRQKIRYNSMGFSPGTNLSINFCDFRGKEYAKSIIISNAGRIKQSKPIADKVCN